MLFRAFKKTFDAALDTFVSEKWQIRLAMHVLNRINGDDDYDPKTNGEYWIIGKIKDKFKGEPLTILDVGANVGAWTLEAAKGLSAPARVFSFEPTNATHAKLKENVEKAGASVVTLVKAALSDRDGQGEMFIDGDYCGTNSVYKQGYQEKWRDVNAEKKVEKVPLHKGDSFCAERGIDRVHFLKIDAEAHEVDILKGFEKMLDAKKIDYIQFEYFHGWINARRFLQEAWAYLEGKGYTVARFRGNSLYYPPAYKTYYEKFETCNYFALKPGAEKF
ncbi:MAG: FkbM family methyltransferase [Elusimicrobia bacterium]|nr:FkbM family methyltransferase [Elusimicrobiota bacterium]